MALDLRANTAVDVLIGPFVDKTDGATAEEGESPAVYLSKNGQTSATKNDATTPTHDDAGYYNCELDATDTNTEGMLVLWVEASANALPVRHEYNVMAEAAWDSMYVAKDDGFMDVNIKTVGRADTQETEANNLEAACAAYSATRGLSGTALPAAAAGAAGGIPTDSTGKTSFNDVSAADVNAQCDTALADYDAVVPADLPANFADLSITVTTGRVDVAAIAGTAQTANDVGADVDAILLDTAEIGAAGIGLTEAGGDGDHLTAINLPNQTMDITGNITGNLSGSVGSVTGAVGSVTGNVGGNVTGSVGSVAAGGIDAAAIATGAIDADALAADAVAEIWAATMSDLAAGSPAYNCSVLTAINYLYEFCRNKKVYDGTNDEIVVYKDDGTTKLLEIQCSDDGTDFTANEAAVAD